ncbi:MAG: ComEC/Rec2 family competence protein [Chloroflexota bacterium]
MPLFWLSLTFLTGIIIAANLTLPTITWLILAGAAVVVASLRPFVNRLTSRYPSAQRFTLTPPLSILLLALTLGAARFQASLPDLDDPTFIAYFNDIEQTMVITGIVIAFPDERDSYTNLRVKTESLHPANEYPITDVQGLVLARVPPESDFHYGDRILLKGQLQTPPEVEEFSYRDYLARQGIYSYLSHASASLLESGYGNPISRITFTLKEHALATAYQLWPDPEASLLAGILLGVETGIPEPVKQAFKDTGTSHIIAISGFNITIVAGLFATLFGRLLNPRRGAIAAVLGIAFYTVLVGADAAVVRAAVMGGLALFARQVGRRQHGLNALAITATLMSLANPHILWDVGFQLSFAATLGLVLYAEPLSQAFIRLVSCRIPAAAAQRLAGPIGEYFLFTLAAQITTLPIMAYHFGRLSLIAFLANPLILPAQPPIMTLGGLAAILGLIWLPLGKLVAPLAWVFILFTIRIVEFLSKFPGGVLVLGKVGILWVVLFYGLLFTGTFAGHHFRKFTFTLKPIPLIAILGVVTMIVWRSALAAPDGLLHLTLLDVGTGDALVIQTPAGGYVLINGGPSTTLLSDGLGRRLPPFNLAKGKPIHRELDWLVVASAREEQVTALPRVLERFPPANVLWAGHPSPSRAVDYLRETLTTLNVPLTLAEGGQILDLGEGAYLHVLTVSTRGAILLLEWDQFRAVIPLGADFETLESLKYGEDIGPVTALLLADNGYAPLNPPEWITNLRPRLALLSVAADDPDGLPSPETIEALAGYTLLRTDRNGWIHLSTDGQQMWVEVER